MEGGDLNTKSWIPYAVKNPFPLENIPFGTFVHPADQQIHCATRVGDFVIDLAWLESEGILAENGSTWAKLKAEGKRVFNQQYLNSFIDLGNEVWHETRLALQAIFGIQNKELYESKILEHAAFAHSEVKLTMPVFIRDYTDFYSSKNHAMNMGIMFRGKDNALMPNWVHIPIGYHG